MIEGLETTETKSKRRGSGSALNCFVIFRWLKKTFIPSTYFFEMFKTLIRTMSFKEQTGLAIFLWLILPVLPIIVLSWYIAEVFFDGGLEGI